MEHWWVSTTHTRTNLNIITMRIIKGYNNTLQCDWYSCTIGDIQHSSPIRANVEAWRDDRLKNSDYYKELAEIRQEGLAAMYKNNHNNWTGD